MKAFYPALLLLIIANTLFAQSTGSINGTIRTQDGNPAQFVNVGLKGTSKGATADSQGAFLITGIAPGSYTVITSFVNLEKQEQTVEVRAGETSTVNFTLSESIQQLNEIIVSENRERYTSDVPSSSLRITTPILEMAQNIQVITGDVLRDQQIISMSDGVIRNVSGAARIEHWGDLYTNIVTRGSQVQAFRNGFNVVNSYWGPLTEDMSFVDHIEFVKGPASFMLANGDPSGLYNVVTKKPTGKTKGEASFTLGSFDLYRATLDLDGKLSKDGKLLYRLNLSGQNKKSFRANEYNNRYVIAPVISYQITDRTKLTAEYTYQRADMSDVGSFYVFSTEGFATLPRNFTSLPAGLPGTKINDHSFYLNLQHQLNDNWRITTQVSRFNYYQMGTSLWPNAVNSDGTWIRSVGSWEAKSTMTMAQIFANGDLQTGNVHHRILGGLDLANKDYFADWGQSFALDSAGAEFDSKNPNLGVPVNGYPHFNYSTPLVERATAIGGLMDQRYTSLYLQDELGFFENKARLTVAGRYTSVSQAAWGGAAITGKHFTPRVGLSVSLNPQTTVYAVYDQAFIPQSGRLTNGNAVKPLTGNNREIGFKRNWADGRWNTTIAMYQILKEHELIADPNQPATSGLSIELGQKRAQGFELDLRGEIVKGLNLTANYAYTVSKITKLAEGITDMKVGDVVPNYAKNTVNAWLGYKIQGGVLKGIGFSSGVSLLGGRKTYWSSAEAADLPTYFRLDAGMFWEGENLRVNFNVGNVLDKYLYSGSYYSYLNAYNWQAEAPRNLRISIIQKF